MSEITAILSISMVFRDTRCWFCGDNKTQRRRIFLARHKLYGEDKDTEIEFVLCDKCLTEFTERLVKSKEYHLVSDEVNFGYEE